MSIQVKVANGNNTRFWTDTWLNGTSVQLAAPDLFRATSKWAVKSRTEREALEHNQWVRDLSAPLNIMALAQYFKIWPQLQVVVLRHEVSDKITWRWTASQ